MPKDQQLAFAKQYGIDVGSFGILDSGNTSLSELGAQGQPIQQEGTNRRVRQIIQKTSNQKLFEEEQTPIFETSYDEAQDLPIYGQFLFDSDVTTYAPVDNAPIPSDYLFGVGDSINLLMFGSKDLELELIVDRNGEINFPELGNIGIAGMTFSELKEHLNERVKNQMIGVNISLSMGKLKSINIFMSGEIAVPGSYAVSALSKVSQLLYVAGGVNNIGSLRKIETIRNGSVIAVFDTYDLLTKGLSKGDIRLQSGDVIFVPPIKKSVVISGAIKRPGRYELIEQETFEDLIKLSGGLNNRAYLKNISLETYDPIDSLPKMINIDLIYFLFHQDCTNNK